jgi:hypothetical protein
MCSDLPSGTVAFVLPDVEGASATTLPAAEGNVGDDVHFAARMMSAGSVPALHDREHERPESRLEVPGRGRAANCLIGDPGRCRCLCARRARLKREVTGDE